MPTIEERALALVNAVQELRGHPPLARFRSDTTMAETLMQSIEAHDATLAEFEAFKREVSDAVEFDKANYEGLCFPRLSRFILAKPDPLLHLAREMALLDGVVRTDSQKAAIREGRAANTAADDFYDRLRTALPARGLKLVEVGDEL